MEIRKIVSGILMSVIVGSSSVYAKTADACIYNCDEDQKVAEELMNEKVAEELMNEVALEELIKQINDEAYNLAEQKMPGEKKSHKKLVAAIATASVVAAAFGIWAHRKRKLDSIENGIAFCYETVKDGLSAAVDKAIEYSKKLKFWGKKIDQESDVPAEKVETPVVETPVVETPVVETPVVETPVVETPVVETPVVETPVVETPVVETPAVVVD